MVIGSSEPLGYPRWALLRFVRELKQRFSTTWRGEERTARRAWLAWLVGGFLACVALTSALTLLTRELAWRGALSWEPEWLRQFAERAPLDFHQAMAFQAPGSSVMLLPAAFVAARIAHRLGRPLHALSLLSAALAIKPIVMVGWWIWARERPDLIEQGLAAPASLHSFPSLHVAQVISFWGLLVSFWVRASHSIVERVLAWSLLALLVVVNLATRLRLGTHWPSDVVAAVLVGAAWLWVLDRALVRAETRTD